MPRVDTGLEHQLAFQQRFGTRVRRLGAAVIGAGLLVTAAPWLLSWWPGHASEHAVARAIVAGTLVMVSGGALVWGRRGKILDRQQQTFATWWGAPWPLAKTIHEIEGFQSVVVMTVDRPEGNHFRVALCCSEIEPLELFDLAEAALAQRTAAQVASFLSLPIGLPPGPGMP